MIYYRWNKFSVVGGKKGDYVSYTISSNRNVYPDDGRPFGSEYWVVFDGVHNPQISGENQDLGSKTDDFVIPYAVTDASISGTQNNSLTVVIRVDGVVKARIQPVTLGRSYDYPVTLDDFGPGKHTVAITASDGIGNSTRTYWFTKSNTAPVISREDLDLGSKTDDFVIPYSVTDPDGDAVTVTIKVDGVAKVNAQTVTLGRSYDFPVALADFSLGQHTVVITASDGTTTASRTYWFTKSNTAPVISDEDRDLGGKSVAFTLNFTVTDENDDDVTVSVLLDGTEIQNVTGAQDQTLTATITNEQLAAMEVDSTHTITIRADDGKGGIAYRRYTFTRVNRAPVISGSNADLGELAEPPSIEYSVTDAEQDEITVEVLLNGTVVQEAAVVEDNEVHTYTPAHDLWIKLPYGQHTFTIRAWDGNSAGNPTTRLYTLTRIAGGLEVVVKVNEFDIQPAKIIAVPHGMLADDAEVQVFVCNNFLDESPTWEDASEMSRIARAYAFTNTAKTSEKWSIGIKIIVENGVSGVSSVLRGIKGGYE